VQPLASSKDPTIEITTELMGEKKGYFTNSSAKSMLFIAANEQDFQQWLLPLRAVAGVQNFRDTPVIYEQLALRKLWAGAVDREGNTALHTLVRAALESFAADMLAVHRHFRQHQEVLQQAATAVPVLQEGPDENSEDAETPVKKESEVEISSSSSSNRGIVTRQQLIMRMQECVKLAAWLIESGCSVNAYNNQRVTPLFMSVCGPLFTAFADACLHPEGEKTPEEAQMVHDCHQFHRDLVHCLVSKGADAARLLCDDVDKVKKPSTVLAVLKAESTAPHRNNPTLLADLRQHFIALLEAVLPYSMSPPPAAPTEKLAGYSYLSLNFSEG
jgi:hypothetical protein